MTVGVVARRGDEYVRLLRDAGVAVTDDAPEVLLADPNLLAGCDLTGVRWVQSTWAGVDDVDWSLVPVATVVTSLPGVFGSQMAEFVFGHLLGRSQRVPERHATRTWDDTLPSTLAGSTIGVLGAGSIGAAIALVARAFGMRIVGCRRSGRPAAEFDAMYAIDEIETFAAGLEHLVVVLPATPESTGLVDARILDLLVHGASVINVGRGSTVVIGDVIDAVRRGQVSLAVLDVTDPEPLGDDHPAWSVPGIVITGHTAAHSRPEDVVGFFVENLARFAADQPLRGVVDRSKGY